MPKPRTGSIVFQPDTYQALLRGINQIVTAVRCTLGPTAGHVAVDRTFGDHKPPEILDSGGVIARRIIQLADSGADMGAMLARAMICRQHDLHGDGTATAAVLFQAIVAQGVRYIAAGGNAMRLRHYLQEGLLVAVRELERMTFRVEGKSQLTRIAETICHDPELAGLLGEIFDTIGEFGQLEVRKHYERGLKREYVEGMYWQKGLLSRQMIADAGRMRTEMQDAAIFISDFELKEAEKIVPILEAAIQDGVRSLVIVVRSLSEQAIAFLLANSNRDKLHVVAVGAPGLNADDRMAALEDLSVLTGGTPLLKVAGHTTSGVTSQAFGKARRVWATHQNFGLVGGQGNPRALRRHIANLEMRFQKSQESEIHKKLQQRIGKLLGGSATLWIGGATEMEITIRKALAERTANSMRAAVREGVVPGGGVALLNCRPALEAAAVKCAAVDERAAYRILSEAVAQPARAIFANAGYDPGAIIARIVIDADGDGFDVLSGQVVNTVETGLLDVAAVQKAALRSAIATAALTLTIDALVHHKQPEIAGNPG